MPVRAFRVIYLALLVGMLSVNVTAAASPIRQLTTTVDSSNLRPTWSADGKRIAYQSNRDGSYHIYVMDTDGGNNKQISSGADIDDRHPAWFLNLQSDPEVTVEAGGRSYTARAEVASPEDRARLWAKLNAVAPFFQNSYQAKTGREIPMVILKER